MGAGPWTFYNNTRKELGSKTFDFAANDWTMRLYQGSSNCTDTGLINVSSLTNEVAGGTGYTLGGKALTNPTWAVGIVPSEYRMNCDNVQWNATGAEIAGIRYAVINQTSSGKLLCFAELDTVPINVAPGNPFVVAPNVGGIFELN